MKILIRLLKEFWAPAVVATAWTAYNLFTITSAWDFKTLVNVFGPSFFIISWATGQFFRVQKQAHVENNLTSIESRVENLVSQLEEHTQDFMGYTTGSGSVAHFVPMIKGAETVELGLINNSTYPVFDFQSEVIDLDEAIDPKKGRFWTRHRFVAGSIYPNKIAMGAYRFDLGGRDRLNLNIFIQTRTQGIIQLIRIAKKVEGFSIATKTMAGDKVIERQVPEGFPGFNPANPDSVF